MPDSVLFDSGSLWKHQVFWEIHSPVTTDEVVAVQEYFKFTHKKTNDRVSEDWCVKMCNEKYTLLIFVRPLFFTKMLRFVQKFRHFLGPHPYASLSCPQWRIAFSSSANGTVFCFYCLCRCYLMFLVWYSTKL